MKHAQQNPSATWSEVIERLHWWMVILLAVNCAFLSDKFRAPGDVYAYVVFIQKADFRLIGVTSSILKALELIPPFSRLSRQDWAQYSSLTDQTVYPSGKVSQDLSVYFRRYWKPVVDWGMIQASSSSDILQTDRALHGRAAQSGRHAHSLSSRSPVIGI